MSTLAGVDGTARQIGEPELRREGFDLALSWPDAIRFTLTAIRDGRDGVRGELTVTHRDRRLSWGSLPLSSTTSREALRKKLDSAAPGLPWSEYLEETAYRLTHAARQGEPIVTLTGKVTSPTRELLPRLLYEGEPTLIYADGDTGKSLFALAVAIAMQTGASLPFGLKPARAVLSAYLDWEVGQDTHELREAMIAAGLGIDPPPILYKRMTRPLVDEAPALAAEFARRGVGFVVIDSKMFAVAGGDGAAFHEPITGFYNALRLFAPAARFVLNHITNDSAKSGTPARPFGGAFAFNGPRLIWEAKREHDVDDATAIVFTCRKANNLPRKPEPFGLRFVPGDNAITVYPFALAEAAPATTAGASLPYRVRLALASGALTVAELAETLGADEGTIKKTIHRLAAKGAVAKAGEAPGKGTPAIRWGLVSRA
ncbi:MAG: AAA family ATPase [Gammaproteobacteria bacterium]